MTYIKLPSQLDKFCLSFLIIVARNNSKSCVYGLETMARLSNEIVNEIVNSCLYLYTKLPKTGKPVEKEWTVLSCVVQYDVSSDRYDVVSLGTGSKCIGAVKMTPDGTIVNDSHAEVFARRGFLLYLYDNLERSLKNEPSIFLQESGKFVLKEDIVFIFYSSQLPCGDASIIPKTGEEEQFGDVIESNKRSVQDVNCEESKKLKLEDDIYRTGAKCLLGSEQDSKEDGNKYHLVSQVRTKPGRGDRTLSVSCSDKMARWIHVGIQGALLDVLLAKPIYIKHFIFGAGVPYSEETLKRAFLKRDLDQEVHLKCIPEFYQCSIIFDCVRAQEDLRPAPGSVVWTKLHEP